MSAEPTRERVEAYEKALGCSFVPGCLAHRVSSTDCEEAGGCPVAVAAARVEAERVAEVERSARVSSALHRSAESDVTQLTAIVERVRQVRDQDSVWSSEYDGWVVEVSDLDRALLPEPQRTEQ